MSAARDLRGMTVVVTGASAGIGAAAARRFGAVGATVAVVGRSPQKTAAVAAAAGAEPLVADFSRLDDVRRLAGTLLDRYPRIDVLANNAGGIFTRRVLTADGHEMTFQVNYRRPRARPPAVGALAGTGRGAGQPPPVQLMSTGQPAGDRQAMRPARAARLIRETAGRGGRHG